MVSDNEYTIDNNNMLMVAYVYFVLMCACFFCQVAFWEEPVTPSMLCGSGSMKDFPMLLGGQFEYRTSCNRLSTLI